MISEIGNPLFDPSPQMPHPEFWGKRGPTVTLEPGKAAIMCDPLQKTECVWLWKKVWLITIDKLRLLTDIALYSKVPSLRAISVDKNPVAEKLEFPNINGSSIIVKNYGFNSW
ncbi:MAG TPA: hypothetical protein VI636_04540 [Candidatus Angelobacter sp.]